MKALFLTIITFLPIFASGKDLDMSGKWMGTYTGEGEDRRIYTERTKDGYYFSRHEFLKKGKVERWILNYGIWHQKGEQYWVDFIVYSDPTKFWSLANCKPSRFNYSIKSINDSVAVYVDEHNGKLYEMQKTTNFPSDFFSEQAKRHQAALNKLKEFEMQCGNKI